MFWVGFLCYPFARYRLIQRELRKQRAFAYAFCPLPFDFGSQLGGSSRESLNCTFMSRGIILKLARKII